MTTLTDLRKAAANKAKKTATKKQTTTATKTATTNKTTSTANKTTTTTQQQKAVEQMAKNIQNQGIVKGSMTTAVQGADNKATQTFMNTANDKEKQAYNTMINEGYTPSETRKAIYSITGKGTTTNLQYDPNTFVDWTDKQKKVYNQLIQEGYSPEESKQAIIDNRKAVTDSMTTGEKRKTRAKAFSQGVSDVGQRIIGKPIDRVAGKIEGALEGTQVKDWAAGKLEDMAKKAGITDADLAAYRNSAQTGPQTYGNILTDREQSSSVGQNREKAGQVAGVTALTLAGGNVAGGTAKALGTAAGSRAVGGLAGAALGAGEGALSSDIYTRGLEDRSATSQERKTGAILGGITGGIGGYKATAKALNQEKELAGLVQDTSNRAKQKAIKEGRVTTKKGLFGTSTTQELSQKEKDALNIIKKEGLGNTKNPGKIVTNIQENISKTASEMSDDMKKIKITNRGKQEIKANLKDAIANSTTSSKKNDIRRLIGKLDNIENADDLRKLRKEYDNLFSEAVKSYNPNGPTPLQEVWMEGRGILNNAINQAADNAGTTAVKEGMKRLSTLITAETNITNNLAKQVGKDSKNWLGRNRKTIVGTAAALTAGKAGVNKISASNKSNYNYSE